MALPFGALMAWALAFQDFKFRVNGPLFRTQMDGHVYATKEGPAGSRLQANEQPRVTYGAASMSTSGGSGLEGAIESVSSWNNLPVTHIRFGVDAPARNQQP